MNNFNNDDLRKTFERIASMQNKIKESYSVINRLSVSSGSDMVLQNLASKISSISYPELNSSLQALAKTMNVYISILNNKNQILIPKEDLITIDLAWKNQLFQLQNTTSFLQQSLESTGIYNLTKTVNILSDYFQDYSILENINIPENIEYELDEAYEKAGMLDIDIEEKQFEVDKTKNSSLSFFDKLTIVLSILNFVVSVHGIYQQHVSNELEEEKIEQLESIDNNLDTINNYLEEIVEKYYENPLED